eukprot:5796249-Alexandrium_andersonii.AAC.1
MQAGPVRELHGCEFFAGVKAITRAMKAMQCKFQSYELLDATDGSQDVCKRNGYIEAVKWVLSIRPGGFIWAAAVPRL